MGEWHEMDCGVAGGWPHDSSLCEAKKATDVHRCKVGPVVEVTAPFENVYRYIGCTGLPRLTEDDHEDLRDLVIELRENVDLNEAADQIARRLGRREMKPHE